MWLSDNNEPRVASRRQARWLAYARASFVLFGFFLPISVFISNLTLACCLVACFLSGGWLGKVAEAAKRSGVAWAVALFIIVLGVGLLNSSASWVDRLEDAHKYAKLFAILLLLPLLQEEERWQRCALQLFAAAAGLTLMLSFLKAIAAAVMLQHVDTAEVFRNHIQTSFSLALFIFFLLHAFIARTRYRWLLFALAVLGVANIFFMSSSRTGYVVMGALLLLLVLQRCGRRTGCLLVIACVLLSCLCVGIFPNNTVSQQLMHRLWRPRTVQIIMKQQGANIAEQSLLDTRWMFFCNTLRLAEQANPLLGSGLGTFQSSYQQRYGNVIFDRQSIVLRTPHNEYLFIFVQLGLLGLLSMLGILVAQWHAARRRHGIWRALGEGVVVAYVVGLACDTLLFVSTTGYLLVFFTVVLLNAPVSRTHKKVARILPKPK